MHASLEALFTSYRQSGRPEPLGAVFDRSSPQLLAVALHLCAHPADAEDALQATFVAAIDGASSWNAKKPLLPWLLGILTNQCRRIGERRARRREQELPSEPLLLDDGTPLAASERRDLIARLREHIDRLPVEQRQVLLLQLEHGLAPAEVAEVLGVPPGTVRMRLHRGLNTLRSVLPATLVALLLAALPSRGVAAVRTAVVARAAAGVALTGGSLLMKKMLAIVAVLVLLGLGIAALTPPWSVSPAPTGSAAVVQQAALPRDRGTADEAVARTEATPARVAAADVATTGSIVVRASFDNGKPIANQPFRFNIEEGESAAIAPTALTDAAGIARIDGLDPGTWRIDFTHLHAAQLANVTAGGVAEVAIVHPAKGDLTYTLHGRVVHATGQPAPGATLVVGGIGARGDVPFGVADGNGCFTVELHSNLCVGARLAGHAPSCLRYCYPRDTITLVLGGPEAIVHGAVVDADGRPIAGATVELAPRDSWVDEVVEDDLAKAPSPQIATTNASGECTFSELVAAPLRVRIRARGFAAFEGGVETVAGATQQERWQLTRGAVLQGKVVDEQGRPIRGYVKLLTYAARACADDGTFHWANAPADAEQFQVGARGFVPRVVAAAALRAGAEPIVLRRWPRYPLRLVDERGEPLAGWSVSLLPRYESAISTDERGVVEVGATTFDAPRLLVSPPGSRGLGRDAVLPLPWPADARLGAVCDVVVPGDFAPTASVDGVVVAADGGEIERAHVQLRTPAGLLFATRDARGGGFHFSGVPARDWQLWIRRDARCGFDPPVHIGKLLEGEERDAGEIRAPADGSLRVTVRTTHGRRPLGLRFLLYDARRESTELPIDGVFHELPAGTYIWNAIVEDACWRAGELEVGAGARQELDVVMPPGARHSLFIELPGARLADVHVDWSLRAPDGTLAFRTLQKMFLEDRLEVHPNLSPGTWHVDVAAADGRRFSGSFDVASGASSPLPIRVELAPVR